MTQMCMVKHDPPYSHGDCVRACIAAAFGLNTRDVPHFTRDGCNGEVMMQRMREWLEPHGLVPMTVAFDTSETPEPVWTFMASINPGVPYILLTRDHAVLCRDDVVIHDPAWVRAALHAPIDNWLIIALVRVCNSTT